MNPVIERMIGNPFTAEGRRRRSDFRDHDWRRWWESLGDIERYDDAATIAMFVGLARPAEIDATLRAIPRPARALQFNPGSCAEIAGRALHVQEAIEQIAGNSSAMEKVRHDCWAAAFGKSLLGAPRMARLFQTTPVLIHGETGTGKELVARSLMSSAPGEWKGREGWAPKPSDAVHLASLPGTLMESALFGHSRGAYTGASDERMGVFQRCHDGVVFLDEIAELSPGTQVALLRVLQEGKARRLGADEDHEARPRIVSATHKDLDELVREGGFRPDLLHRLSSVVIRLPPLAARREDIPDLVRREVRQLVDQTQAMDVCDAVLAFVERHRSYTWPGNVRELHAVVRTLALGLEPQLRAPTRSRDRTVAVPPGIADTTSTLREVVRWYCGRVVKTRTQVEAARILDIDRSTLRGHLSGGDDA